jgi:uncharacterized membrane protein
MSADVRPLPAPRPPRARPRPEASSRGLTIPHRRRANPSAWGRRAIVLLGCLLGGAIGTYLALYQLGVVGTVWDPFFGAGSEHVLHSRIARLLPVPDAALGAVGYLAEALTAALGGAVRWRTAPRAVLLYGLVAAGVAGASLLLVVLQGTVVRAWCTLCLVSAGLSVALAALALDEAVPATAPGAAGGGERRAAAPSATVAGARRIRPGTPLSGAIRRGSVAAWTDTFSSPSSRSRPPPSRWRSAPPARRSGRAGSRRPRWTRSRASRTRRRRSRGRSSSASRWSSRRRSSAW